MRACCVSLPGRFFWAGEGWQLCMRVCVCVCFPKGMHKCVLGGVREGNMTGLASLHMQPCCCP